MNIATIDKIIGSHKSTAVERSGFAPSAVNIILLDGEEPEIIFVRRSSNLKVHRGQFAFPGGKREDSDNDLWETAGRETFEEIGIRTEDLQLLGNMDDFLTISNYNVRPFISRYTGELPCHYYIDKGEIDYVVQVPLSFLLNSANVSLLPFPFKGRKITVPHFWYHGNIIWGVTGYILFRFLKLIGGLEELPSIKDGRVEELL